MGFFLFFVFYYKIPQYIFASWNLKASIYKASSLDIPQGHHHAAVHMKE